MLCQNLAEGHAIGLACPGIGPDLFAIDYVSRVAFFRRRTYGVRIVSILHQRQVPELHSFENDEDE